MFGELHEKETDLLKDLLDLPPRSSGYIYFDSCGGSVYVGLAVATVIRLRGLKATAIVLGECSSAALMPFAACRERYVTPHATLLFHPMRWQTEEDVRLEEAAEWARHFQVLEDDLDLLLARMFDCPLEKIREWSRPGKFLRGGDLVEAGLAKMLTLFDGDLRQQIRQQQQG